MDKVFEATERKAKAKDKVSESARRSPAGSLALCESEAAATKRIARSGNQSPQIN
ncbi:hypothetical protein [Lysinibacillus sp. TE18511]